VCSVAALPLSCTSTSRNVSFPRLHLECYRLVWRDAVCNMAVFGKANCDTTPQGRCEPWLRTMDCVCESVMMDSARVFSPCERSAFPQRNHDRLDNEVYTFRMDTFVFGGNAGLELVEMQRSWAISWALVELKRVLLDLNELYQRNTKCILRLNWWCSNVCLP